MPERPQAQSSPRTDPLISVIVTTYTMERAKDVLELLESMKAQTYPHLEIIFVGEGYPELCDMVAMHAQQLGMIDFRAFFNQGPPGLSHARNLGVEQSKGEIVAFVDDDAVAFPDWAENIVRAFAEHSEAIGLTGPAFPRWEDESMRWFPEEFFWVLSCPTPGWTGYTTPTIVRSAWGMNMAFRREAFDSRRFSEAFVGGSTTAADEVEFSMRVRRDTRRVVLFHPAVSVWHKVYRNRLSTTFIRKKAFRDGYAKAVLKKLYPREDSVAFTTDIETALLRRILLQFVPAMLGRLPKDPVGTWRRARVASIALLFIGAGYLRGSLSRPAERFKRTEAQREESLK